MKDLIKKPKRCIYLNFIVGFEVAKWFYKFVGDLAHQRGGGAVAYRVGLIAKLSYPEVESSSLSHPNFSFSLRPILLFFFSC